MTTLSSPPLNTALFQGHDLAAQQHAPLMERIDTKYLVPHALLNQILPALQNDYTALTLQGRQQMRYASLYFDTPKLDCYHTHHNGKLNRYKVRLRHYLETQETFAEVKFRSNRERTVKQRIQLPDHAQELAPAQNFVQALIGPDAARLRPVLHVRYHRITLLDTDQSERTTIDTALEFELADSAHRLQLPGLAVVEVKTRPGQNHSRIRDLMKMHRIRPLGFSKYCMGLALASTLTPALATLKRNRFKPALGLIDRLIAPATATTLPPGAMLLEPTVLVSRGSTQPSWGTC